jgi:regulator of CtrA degradation
VSGGLVETTFFNRTYDEAISLAVEARDYIADRLADQRRAADVGDRLVYDSETLRLTTRIAQVVAWLLAQRALHEGELTREDLRGDQYRLEADDVCLDNDPEILEALPVELQSLMGRSLSLYQRIARLDEMVQRDAH